VSDDDRIGSDRELAEVLALVVHDLRNPIATISANLSFIRQCADLEDEEAHDALDDVQDALSALTHGLEQIGWIGGWFGGSTAIGVSPGDARDAVCDAVEAVGGDVELDLPDDPVRVEAAGPPLGKLVEVFLRSAQQHGHARVRLTPDAAIEILDDGPAVGADLREQVFSMRGQREVKSRRDGRYVRVVGLLAARALAETLGATVEADGEDGAAVFRIRLRASPQT